MSRNNFDKIRNFVSGTCDTLHRTSVHPTYYLDFLLCLPTLKYLSVLHNTRKQELLSKPNANHKVVNEYLDSLLFKMPEDTYFEKIYELRHESGNGERLLKAFFNIERHYKHGQFYNVFYRIEGQIHQLSNQDLCDLLEYLNNLPISLEFNSSYKNMMKDLSKYLFMIIERNSHEYRTKSHTPENIAKLLATLLNPRPNEEICDPLCSTGTLLATLGEYVRKSFGDSKSYKLYGQDNYSGLAKINMLFLAEDNVIIEDEDVIYHPKLLTYNSKELLKFDVIISNLIFSQTSWEYDKHFAKKDPFNRFYRGLPPKSKKSYALISHMIETLKDNTGRMAILVPNTVLFGKSKKEANIRKQLIEENLLDAVISLPIKILSLSPIPVNILIFNKNKSDNNILFIDASKDFIKISSSQNDLTNEHINKIHHTYTTKENVIGYASLVSINDIAKNNFNLIVDLYIK